MSELSGMAMITGAATAMLFLPMLFLPRKASAFLAAFPRNKIAGWVLTAIDLVCAALLLLEMKIEFIEARRNLIYLAVPAAFALVAVFMDELLAARALGGFLLMFPAPLLDAARQSVSPWSLVIKIFCYIAVVAGMTLVMSPYMFRKIIGRLTINELRCRITGAAGLSFAIFLIMLALTAFGG